MYQFGPAGVENPQRTAAVFTEIALGRTGFAIDYRMVYRTFGLSRNFEGFIFGTKVDCKPAAPRSFATNRAVAEIVRIRMRRIDFEFNRTAMTGSLEFHRIICLPKRYRCHGRSRILPRSWIFYPAGGCVSARPVPGLDRRWRPGAN